jgi:hypothetical protein
MEENKMFRKHLTALAVLGIVIGGFAVASVSCSIYHMQTPQTVPPGKWSGGAALSAYGGGTSSGLIYFPGFWIRTGITPRFDVGLHTWMAGFPFKELTSCQNRARLLQGAIQSKARW